MICVDNAPLQIVFTANLRRISHQAGKGFDVGWLAVPVA